MNSTVTRGRGEMVVTATGMATEVGQISGMLAGVEQEKTPLTRQLDQLTVLITIMAAAALALVIIFGLIRGDDFDELFVIGIALAIAAIPTGLPAVVTTMLSLGTQALAAKGAIVKRLRSVETLGSTSAICSDKTGTLTLNQMTARQLVVVGRRYSIDGEGYSTAGQDSARRRRHRHAARAVPPADGARQRRGRARRRDRRRPDRGGARRPRRKGWARRRRDAAPLPACRRRCRSTPSTSSWRRSTRWRRTGGRSCAASSRARRTCCSRALRASARPTARRLPSDGAARDRVLAENDRLAGEGLRVLAVASRDFDPSAFDVAGDLLAQVQDLTLLALVGIVDPPRKEARDAIALCKDGGHPRADDHRRPRDHRRGDRRAARDRGPRAHGHGVRRDERRGARTRAREHRRRRARCAGGQGPARRHAEAAGATSYR